MDAILGANRFLLGGLLRVNSSSKLSFELEKFPDEFSGLGRKRAPMTISCSDKLADKFGPILACSNISLFLLVFRRFRLTFEINWSKPPQIVRDTK
ncbi:hypothetical protein Y032_0333g2796 [Ancylostoma ceylanicum]|uniref:Uncharacterized protein n=1 Tax=Ancylostoma ceylanicum TaxID=53326 RepID=A0A016RZ68_9BILA|nr:hypothetical protein Y032_0333g2796 [Ancylostoma ceylanicum]